VADAVRGQELHAPELLSFELANTAVKKVSRGHLDAATAGLALSHLARLDIRWHRVPPDRLVPLALAAQLTAYDAAYLVLAESSDARLLTADATLAAAAGDRALLVTAADGVAEDQPPYRAELPWPAWKGAVAYLSELRGVVGTAGSATRYTRRASATPFKSRSPRSAKAIGDPASSSRVAHEA